MLINHFAWPTSRGLINTCNVYTNNRKQEIKVIRRISDEGKKVIKVNHDAKGYIKKIVTYVTDLNNNMHKTIEHK